MPALHFLTTIETICSTLVIVSKLKKSEDIFGLDYLREN